MQYLNRLLVWFSNFVQTLSLLSIYVPNIRKLLEKAPWGDIKSWFDMIGWQI